MMALPRVIIIPWNLTFLAAEQLPLKSYQVREMAHRVNYKETGAAGEGAVPEGEAEAKPRG